MADCGSCEREAICEYQYKPCDCVGYRKFVPAASISYCDACGGGGWNPYPIKCRSCNGCGHVRTQGATP